MTIFHKITTTALALSLVASLASCSAEEETTTPDSTDSSAGTQVETQGETQKETGTDSDAETETADQEEVGEVTIYAEELFALVEESEAVIVAGNAASDLLMMDIENGGHREDLTQAMADLAEVKQALSDLDVPSQVSEVHKLFINDYLQMLGIYEDMMNLLLTADLSDGDTLTADLDETLADLETVGGNLNTSLTVLVTALESLV